MARIGPDPAVLGVAYSTIYTVTTSPARQATFIQIGLCNTASTVKIPSVRMVPSGVAGAAQHRIIGGTKSALQPGQTMVYTFRQFLEDGDFIEWSADGASAITGWLGAIEATKDTTLYANIDAGYLTSITPGAEQLLATVPANRQATMLEIILHNTDTVDHIPTIYLPPSGGTPGVGNALVGVITTGQGVLKPGETRVYTVNLMRAAGSTVEALVDVANKVVCKLSYLSEAV